MKKFLSILVAMMLLVSSLFVLASCADPGNGDGGEGGDGEPGDGKITLTVTVVDADGAPIPFAKVVFIKDGMSYPAVTADALGVATTRLNPGEFKAKLAECDEIDPDVYVVDTVTEYSFTNNAVTIVVDFVDKPTYTITVVDQYGDAVVGARVQACIQGGSCYGFSDPTDSEGKSSQDMFEENYSAQITQLPQGYTGDGQYHEFSGNAEDGFTVTIFVTKD